MEQVWEDAELVAGTMSQALPQTQGHWGSPASCCPSVLGQPPTYLCPGQGLPYVRQAAREPGGLLKDCDCE